MPRRPQSPLVRIAVGMFAIGAAASCTSIEEHAVRVVPGEAIVPWLMAGRTTRTELIERLGPPQRQLEAGRILIWELDEHGAPQAWKTGEPHPGNWDIAPRAFHLVAVAANDHVERTSLVRVWR